MCKISHAGPKSLGFLGENIAANYLQSKGYEILKNNFTVRGGEIDIIAYKSNVFVFVEVKTRTSQTFGSGEENFTFYQKQRIERTIQRYLAKTKNDNSDYRLDLIDIELNPSTKSLKNIAHFEDIEI